MSRKGYNSARDSQDFIKLLIKIDRYAQSNFQKELEKSGADKKKFETDMKYFTEWFEKSYQNNRSKFEFFYGPYLEDNKNILKSIKKRRAQSVKALREKLAQQSFYEGTNFSYDMRKSIDTESQAHGHGHGHEHSPELDDDVRKKWSTHLAYDPKSIAEQEGNVDHRKQ